MDPTDPRTDPAAIRELTFPSWCTSKTIIKVITGQRQILYFIVWRDRRSLAFFGPADGSAASRGEPAAFCLEDRIF
jgi:hypothetical protein